MLSPGLNGAHTIHRLEGTSWVDTGTLIDARPVTKEDVLSEGTTLYILSRSPGAFGSSKLSRYTYGAGTYLRDPGFPVDVPGSGQESNTIGRDSTGTLWITYERSNSIWVSRSVGGDDAWSAPVALPFPEAQDVDSDDISAVVSFHDAAGPAVGVMWSNQTDAKQYFAVHRDGAPPASWQLETALSGPLEADDHINLKTFEGQVYAVAKTSATSAAAPLIRLLKRSTTGTWTTHPVARVDEQHTRPITLLSIDPADRSIYVFMTRGTGAGAQGIVYKKTGIDGIGFPAQATWFIQGLNGETINNATSTKQNGDAASGIVVLASDGTHYWHNAIGYPSGSPTPTPTATATLTPTPTATPSPPPPPSDGIVHHSASVAANSTATTLTIAAPSGLAAGDLLLASIDARGKPQVVAPTGWTLVRADQNGNTMTKATFYRIATMAEPASHTWTFSSAVAASGAVLTYRGVDPTSPIEAHGGQVNAKSTAISAPSVTASTSGARLVGLFGIASATTVAPPTGFTELGEVSSTAGTYKVTSEGSNIAITASGPTGSRVATASHSAGNIGQVVVLRPAP
jgi:hypothetical protein